jgi:psp operon transcriptional activator
VRELKNTVERAVYVRPGPLLDEADLEFGPLLILGSPRGPARERFPDIDISPRPAANPGPPAAPDFPWPEGEFDRRTAAHALGLFNDALAQARHNQREAARLLGLTYHRFRFLRKKAQQGLNELED